MTDTFVPTPHVDFAGATSAKTPDQIRAEQAAIAAAMNPQPPQPPAPQLFTPEQVEAFREQERNKVYPELQATKTALQEMQASMAQIQAERDAARAAEAEAQRQAEAAAEAARIAAENEGLTLKERLQRLEETNRELTAKFEQTQAERDRNEALLNREREFQALQAYKSDLLGRHANDILPNMIPLIDGGTREEIDAKVQAAIQQSALLVQELQQQQRQQWQAAPGVSPAGAPGQTFDPGGENPQQRQFSAEDINNMSMAEFARYRSGLIGSASAQFRNRP